MEPLRIGYGRSMKTLLIFAAGALIFSVTFLAWVWLNAFACGMNTTGCSGFSLSWHDWEALRLFIPTFLIGAGLMVWGVWRGLKR